MRPTVALACILKNEVQNLPRLLASVKGCFDEIHLTDTGSTDGSLELIQSYIEGENPAETKIFLHHFEWIKDFSAARNYAFSHPKTDYIMWLDLDDVLSDAEAFKGWRDNVMSVGEFWLATYNYALTPEGKPVCSFARERVVKRDLGFTWNYPVHEGMLPKSPKKRDIVLQYATTWSVNHLRSAEDLLSDRSRNIEIMRAQKNPSARLRYYLGKELFENNKILEGYQELTQAIALPDLELHDRIMGTQYACMAAMRLNEFEKAVQLAHVGLQLAPNRAEFLVVIADCYIKMNKVGDAIPYYMAASACRSTNGGLMQGPIFSMEDAYTHYPLNQLARIHANLGDIEKANYFLEKAATFGKNGETDGITREIAEISAKIGYADPNRVRTKTTDIIVSCPPGGLYEWDGDTYRSKGIGGSETAAVEMCEWMAKLTGRRVIIFNKRPDVKTINGVEYMPSQHIAEYLRDNEPALHITWRHVTKLSSDPYYVWCHDLAAPGIETKDGNFKILSLSEFHKRYLQHMFAVPAEKIIVTSNGIKPERFMTPRRPKEFGKIVYSSSPDRGLDRAIAVMDEVVKVVPEAKLHVYYGFENMHKMGMGAQADDLKRLALSKPYVVFHGNIPQSELTKEFETACVWLYPTNFLETYCITAVEAICSGVYPVVRKWGGLQDTLRIAAANGMAAMLDSDCLTKDQIKLYADTVTSALQNKLWENVHVDPEQFSWEGVARSWIEKLLPEDEACRQSRQMLSSSTTRP